MLKYKSIEVQKYNLISHYLQKALSLKNKTFDRYKMIIFYQLVECKIIQDSIQINILTHFTCILLVYTYISVTLLLINGIVKKTIHV